MLRDLTFVLVGASIIVVVYLAQQWLDDYHEMSYKLGRQSCSNEIFEAINRRSNVPICGGDYILTHTKSNHWHIEPLKPIESGE